MCCVCVWGRCVCEVSVCVGVWVCVGVIDLNVCGPVV